MAEHSPTPMKACSSCEITKPLADFWQDKRRSDSKRSKCAQCAKAANRSYYQRDPAARVQATKKWRSKNLDFANAYLVRRRQQIKKRVIDGYGGACVCCGERDIDFLGLEHKNGGGRQHRAERGTGGVYLDVIKAGFPNEFTILCMNCNHASWGGKICPHKRVAKEAA